MWHGARLFYAGGEGKTEVQELSSKKKEKSAPMPTSSAGLLRFFEEDTQGIKIRPEVLIGASAVLMVVSILVRWLFPF